MATFSKNLHVPLSEELYRKLRNEAQRSKRPATDLVRTAITAWIQERERQALAQAVSDYARRQAGKSDLDEDLEAAAAQFLIEQE